MKPALVDLNHFLTSLKMMKQWDLGTAKFWELTKKERLDEILFHDNISGSEATSPKTAATAGGTGYFKYQANVSVEQDILNDDEDIDVPGSPDIGDDFSRAELIELREHIYQP